MNEMTRDSRRIALLTALALSRGVLNVSDDAKRVRYRYIMSFVGDVCKKAFQAAFYVSNDKLTGARLHGEEGRAFLVEHENASNQNNKFLPVDELVAWFRNFASLYGDIMAVRFRTQKTRNGVVHQDLFKVR